MSEIPQWLSTLGAAISGIGLGGYAIHRRLKNDNNNDSIDSKTQLLIDQLQEQLKLERDHTSRLGNVIDRLSEERNNAVRVMGELNGQIISMTNEIRLLTGEVNRQEEVNIKLNESVRELRDQIMDMTKKIFNKEGDVQ